MVYYDQLKISERGVCMKRSVALVMMVMGILAIESGAQTSIRWMGSDGWGIGTRYEQMFNNYNLIAVAGSIFSIDTMKPMTGMAKGIQLIIRTPSREEIIVHLGPAWFIQRQDMNLGLNDKVDIRGARFSLNGKDVIAAFEVRSGEKVLLLRDEDGLPNWCGWRKRKI